ncbi:MAG: S-layer homology domain-containing protein [Clostridia bacterium]|nr:S-layer homology domain-containing protein [Clostridia bacterium]
MKNLNKVFAMLLVVAMMMTSVVFADFSDVADDAAYAEAINVGVALGLFTGYEDGTFQPEGNITRAEFAAMVVRALNQENQAKSAATAITAFPDVAADHWANGYINIASKKGIINGYEDGTFRPENNVTFEEAVKMLVVAIGHEPEVGAAGYPVGYLTVADDYDITDDAMGVVGEAATRGLVSQLLLNAMDTPLMEQVGYGAWLDYQVNDGYNDTARETLLSENHGIVKLRVTVKTSSLLEGTNANDEEYVTVDILNTYGSKYTESEFEDAFGALQTGYTILSGETDIAELVGKNAIVYAYYNPKSQDEPVAVYATVDTTKTYELTISTADIASVVCDSCPGTNPHTHDDDAFTVNYYKTATDKKATPITINEDATLYINGVLTETANADAIIDELVDAYGTITFQKLDRTIAEDYDTIFITNYETYVVESVSGTRYKVYSKNNGNFTYYDEDGDVVATLVDATGAEMAWEDLKENDIISVVESVGAKTVIKAELLTATVGGRVTGVSSDETEYVIAGETYAVDGINVDPGDIALGDEGTFFLDAMGNICYYDTTAELNTNYAVIVKVGTNGSTLDEKTAIKVFTYDGQFGTLNTAAKVKLDGIANIISKDLDTNNSVTFDAETSAKYFEKYGRDNYNITENDPGEEDDVIASVKALADGDIITFKTNAAGEITEITRAFEVSTTNGNKGKFTRYNDPVTLTYNEKSESFTGAASKLYVTDKTVVIVANMKTSAGDAIDLNGATAGGTAISDRTEDDFSLFNVANIVDEQVLYNAQAFNVNEDKEVGFIYVETETEAVDAAAIMALVTGKGTSSDDEGNTVWNIKVLQDGLVKDGVEEDALVTDGDTDFGVVAYDTIVPKYNAAGEVKDALILASTDGSTVTFDNSKMAATDKVKYYFGTVTDIDRKEFTITAGGGNNAGTSFVVDNATNVYVYNCLVNSKYAASIDSYDVVEFDELGQAYYGTTEVSVKVVAREFDEELIDLVIYILPNA